MAYPSAHSLSKFDMASLKQANIDTIICIAPSIESIEIEEIRASVEQYAKVDSRANSQVVMVVSESLQGLKLIYSPTGDLSRYYDDVRRYHDAAKAAAAMANQSGSKNVALLVTGSEIEGFENARAVAYLGITQQSWQPLEAREHHGEDEIETMTSVHVYNPDGQTNVAWANAAEAGLRVARDLCGTEPERMAPPKFADYCVAALQDTDVKVSVMSEQRLIEEQYPMLFSVARASEAVERHHARVILMEYEPEGEITQSIFLAGKGITYDTGGADLKTGGHMAGMSRDKGGAASVAGFMKMVSELKPKGIKIVAAIGAVRNSIGADAFVSDEIITSRAGVRVRIGNTDAEGRLVLGDMLTKLMELSEGAPEPEFFSVATLTGHAARAVGPYSALVENGEARKKGSALALSNCGDLWADPAEVSRSRREDYDFIKPRTKADDVLSSNNAASAVTARGHQFPMAFLALTSGLSSTAHPYTHVDIAGSGVEGGDWQHGKPTGAALLMLAEQYLKA